jgi:hypothetical protein
MKKRTKTQTELKTIADLKPAEFNPRTITADALGGLTASVAEFGDISGIVYNLRLGCLVAGHQRVAALRQKYGDALEIRKDSDGGVIETPGGSFRVRFVDWDEARTRAAMLTANNPEIQGDWTDGVVAMLETMKTDTAEMFAGLKLDELMRDLQTAVDGGVELKPLKPQAAPAMAWVLIGIPTVRFGEINEAVERIAAITGAMVETTVTSA